jgi:hypothetical protein
MLAHIISTEKCLNFPNIYTTAEYLYRDAIYVFSI